MRGVANTTASRARVQHVTCHTRHPHARACHRPFVPSHLLLFAMVVVLVHGQPPPSLQVTISVHPTQQLSVEQLYESAVPVTFTATSNWNLSCVVSKFSDALFTVSPTSTRFGFSVQTVFPQFNAADPSDVLYLVSGRLSSLVVVFGPTQRYLPESFQESVTIAFPPECFAAAATSTVQVAPVTMAMTAVNDRTTQERVSLAASVAIALAAVASGSTGWIGLTSLQTFVIMANSTCAEPYTSHYFEDAAGIVAIPFYSVLDSNNAQVFGVSIGCCVGLLAVHALMVTLVRRCSTAVSSRVTWRSVAQRLFFPGPFLFASVYLWLSITVTAYREVVRSQGGNFTRPALVVAWGVLAGLLAIIWYDGLKRGFDGHFALYPWFSQRVLQREESMAAAASDGNARSAGGVERRQPGAHRTYHDRSSHGGGGGGSHNDGTPTTDGAAAVPFKFLRRFGRFQFVFLPKGRWVNTRGFGIVRANCDDLSYRFAALTLVAVAAFGAVVVNNTECDWYFGSIMIVEVLYLAAFCAILPFRVPMLNIAWLGMKLTVLVVCALHVYWLEHADTPNNKTAISIRLASTAFIGLCGIFVGYNLVMNFVERSIQTTELLQRVIAGGASENGALRSRQATLLRWLKRGPPSPKPAPPDARHAPRLSDLAQPMLREQCFDSDEQQREGDDVELLAIYARPLVSPSRRQCSSSPHRDDAAVDPLSFLDIATAAHSPLKMPDGQPGDTELEDILVEMDLRFGPVAPAGHHQRVGGTDTRHHHRAPSDAHAREGARNLLKSFWAVVPPPVHAATAAAAIVHGTTGTDDGGLKVFLHRPIDSQVIHQSQRRPAQFHRAHNSNSKRRRVVLKVEPPPSTLTNDQFAFVIEAASGPGTVLDMSTLGNAVFVGMKGLAEAKTAGSALHGRWLFGTTLACVVIEDAEQPRGGATVVR